MKQDQVVKSSEDQKIKDENLIDLFCNSPIPNEEKLFHLGLYIKRQNMSRLIQMNELYKKILDVHGSVFEFGVRWGQNLALFESFRGMYEPFNYNRKLVGFDTFSGFPSVSKNDKTIFAKEGDMRVSENYEEYLEKLLLCHENESPISHMKKFELVKGDATVTCKKYLKDHPETIIAFAYFDFDIYEPTKICLELCKDRFVKGSVIAFDELNHPDWPGETIAAQEVLGLRNIRLQRMSYNPTVSYLVVE